MRNKATPEQIDRVLEDLREIWLSSPEQRLGQLVLNLVYLRGVQQENVVNRLWNMDEEEFLLAIQNWWDR